MNYLKTLMPLVALTFLMSTLISCSKVDKTDQGIINPDGLVALNNPGIQDETIEFSKETVTFSSVIVARPGGAATTIIIQDDTAAVNAAGFTPLPENAYTVNDANPKTGAQGGTYSMVFNEGEQSKSLSFSIPDPTVLDPGKTYGLAFTLVSAGQDKISPSAKTTVISISAKSAFDGVYRLKGVHSRDGFSDAYDEEVHLISTGANSVKMYWPALAADAHPIHGGTTYYSNFTTEFSIGADKTLASVVNSYNTKATPFKITSGNASRYDEATKTLYARYYYNNDASRLFTDTLVYIGKR